MKNICKAHVHAGEAFYYTRQVSHYFCWKHYVYSQVSLGESLPYSSE